MEKIVNEQGDMAYVLSEKEVAHINRRPQERWLLFQAVPHQGGGKTVFCSGYDTGIVMGKMLEVTARLIGSDVNETHNHILFERLHDSQD